MSAENEQAIIVERLNETTASRASTVIPLRSKREEVDTGFQTLDAEYHAAGFCACCMRGE